MDDVTVLFARAMRFVRVRQPIFMVDVIRELHRRYEFVRIPVTLEEIHPAEPTTPVSFSYGRLLHGDREIIINNLGILPMAITVDAAGSTEDGDLVIDDLISFANNRVNGLVTEAEDMQSRFYISQLEFKTTTPMFPSNKALDHLNETFVRLMGGYDRSAPADVAVRFPSTFQMVSLAMKTDPAEVALPAEFKIERRSGRPHAENVYFSQAPLSTGDHKLALSEYERVAQGET